MKVELRNLTKVFPARDKRSGEPVVAVDHFNFTIPDGELIGLLGPSGCGKSTTLYMICGLLEPSEGQIFFGEDDVTDLPPEERGVGLVFQNYALYPHLTVRQNILFPLQNFKGADKLSKEEMNARTEAAARLVRIASPPSCLADSSSGSPLRGRWSNGRASCFWTSRCPIWTRACACGRARRSSAFSGKPASRPCSSRTTRRRQCPSPTASWS